MVYIAYDPIYQHKLPDGHRFPMEKYDLIPSQLLHEGLITPFNFIHPGRLSEDEILTTHQLNYWNAVKNLTLSEQEIRRIGFPLSLDLIEREVCIAQGTVECSWKALEHGIAYNVAGGTHHSFTNKGEGFCILNDQAIAANLLLTKGNAQKIVIIDLDVHQGNGTAEIFSKDSRVFTFSMHGRSNYPFHKEKSDMDIGLSDQIEDLEYLDLLEENLNQILNREQPDFIFYQAGVDILSTDRYGKLNISRNGCLQRDQMVIGRAHQEKIPIMVCMGGGYSPRISDIVDAHCNTFKVGLNLYS